MQKLTDPLRSRMPVLVAVITIATFLCIGTYTRGNVAAAWKMMQIPSTNPLFADTITVTNSIDCLLAGQNPYKVGSFDPFQRLYNYPPIWLKARYLGITSRSTNLVGTMLALSTIAACLLLFRTKTWVSALIVFFALTSKATLFLVERGNIDQLIFFLLVFGFFLIDRQRAELKSLFTGILVGVLTVLKIYPVVTAVVFIRNRNGFMKTLLVAVLSIAALIVTAGHSLPVVLSNTPRDSQWSFGAFPFFMAIGSHSIFASVPPVFRHRVVASLGGVALGALSLVAAFIYRDRVDQFFPQLDFDHARGRLAISGLAIFCFVFVSGASYNYRLIFLLGILAYLVEDIDNGTTRRSVPTAILLVLLMWGSFSLSMFREILDGLTFVLATAWLGTSLIPYAWKRADISAIGTQITLTESN
ncbi:glycosyltransferase 87 family protein [Tunturibacter psychrotolerans]|uniref:Glycosyltransferase 87 family protein n=1 Tax=Tunturiibacter psychrotolerans TaxID=3069686 RepID=A0AAU7ZPJ6_9BACT